jgi:hypothetical protein
MDALDGEVGLERPRSSDDTGDCREPPAHLLDDAQRNHPVGEHRMPGARFATLDGLG